MLILFLLVLFVISIPIWYPYLHIYFHSRNEKLYESIEIGSEWYYYPHDAWCLDSERILVRVVDKWYDVVDGRYKIKFICLDGLDSLVVIPLILDIRDMCYLVRK